jgi:hypothetical protein
MSLSFGIRGNTIGKSTAGVNPHLPRFHNSTFAELFFNKIAEV